MRIDILENGVVVNTINADEEFAEAQYPGAWRLADVQDEPVPAVPQVVTRRQARQALLLAGLLDNVQPAIDAIPDPVQRQMAQIEWDDSLEFQRTRPLLVQLGSAIGLDDVGLDALFVAAKGL